MNHATHTYSLVDMAVPQFITKVAASLWTNGWDKIVAFYYYLLFLGQHRAGPRSDSISCV